MPSINARHPALFTNIHQIYSDSLASDDSDIWFDVLDHVDMQDTWFDVCEEHQVAPLFSAGEAADARVPFTEDCRRGIQLFFRTLMEYGESKILSICLEKILPNTPASLVIAANSVYTAVTERRDIDIAVLHVLGLVSGYLPENMNVVSLLASFIRDTVIGWVDETFLHQFLGDQESPTATHVFIALAVTSIVAGRCMKDEGGPQRGMLKVPTFIANIFIRTCHYWASLGNMMGNCPSSVETTNNIVALQHAPAFEVDTLLEMTGNVYDGSTPCFSSPSLLTAFSSNSTVNHDAYSRGIVKNRPVIPAVNQSLSFCKQAHYFAVNKLRQESGLAELLYCVTRKTEFHQQSREKIVTSTYFNTKCDATVVPESLTKMADSMIVQPDVFKTPVSSPATGQGGGDALLPLVMTGGIVTPVLTSYMQTLKSKTLIAAGASFGLTGFIGGIWLWNNRESRKRINYPEMILWNITHRPNVDVILPYDKNKTHENNNESTNKNKINLDGDVRIDSNEIKGNFTDWDVKFKKYMMKNVKYRGLDDYDYISCFLASQTVEFSKMKFIDEYPRLGNFSLNKVIIIVNEDISKGINTDIYNIAIEDDIPEKLIPFLAERKGGHDERMFYDTYHRYKKIISSYSKGMAKNIPLVLYHIRLASEELYATYKSDESFFLRREELRLELYHLNKLINNQMNIEFRPLTVRSVAKLEGYYPPYEEVFAGSLLETVIYDLEDIPEKNSVIYGPAYQARKTLLAYSLYICGIDSIDAFKKSELNKKDSNGKKTMSDQDMYEYLVNKAVKFISITGNSILQEISQHFIYSLAVTMGLLPNINIKINISESQEKKLGLLTLQEKRQSFIYYLNQTIEKSPRKIRKRFGELIYLSFLIEVFSSMFKSSSNNLRGRKKIKIIPNELVRTINKQQLNVKGDEHRIKKPKREDFSTEQDYKEALNRYKEDYMRRYNHSGKTEFQIRKEKAEDKMAELNKIYKVSVVEESVGPLKLWTEKNNRASTLVLSSHGWYEKYDRVISPNSIPKNKNIVFLGPNKEKLYEAGEEFCKSATESLFIPGRYPEIYTRINSDGVKTQNTPLGESSDNVMNYRIKYYEKTPDIEYKVAVIGNRGDSDIVNKVDFAAMHELGGEKKLSDIIKYTKPGQALENYNTIVFYACREYKCQGKMASGIGGGYTIKFTDVPLSEQQRTVRNTPENGIVSDSVNFDGISIIDKYTVKIGRWDGNALSDFNYTVDIVGITPYRI